MKSAGHVLTVVLAGAAFFVVAAVASATSPQARGGHAVTLVAKPKKAAHRAHVRAIKNAPARGSLLAPATPTPTGGSLVAPEPIVTAPGEATLSLTIVQTGSTITLNAVASPCVNGGCDFSWRAFRVGGNRLGSTVGFGALVTATLPEAGVYTVVLTESEYCAPGGGASLRSCPRTAQQTVTIP